MDHSFTASSNASTRLTGGWLWIARLAWLIILLLAAGKLAIGLPRFYTEKARVCTASVEICKNTESLDMQQAAALETAGVTLIRYARAVVFSTIFHSIVWGGVGLLIFILRSDDWMALIASAMMIVFTTGQYTDPIARAYPGLAIPSQFIFDLQNILLFLFISLFPSGRFVPRWIRWYWLVMCTISLVPTVLLTNLPDSILVLFWLSFLTFGPYSQIYRYFKSSTLIERQQTKWVVFGFTMMAGLILIQFAVSLFFPNQGSLRTAVLQDFYFDLASIFLPISIGISILRYRLWDIDVIIRRTLIYGAFTVTLALIFFLGVTLLQSLFVAISNQKSAISIVISTLAIYVLFSPLRIQIQNIIDRRFFRRKYDAQKILERFANSVRNEVELEQLTDHLLAVVHETMQPKDAALWFPKRQK